MATAKRREPVVEIIKKVVVPGGVTLELTDSEAQTLVEVLFRVGGDPRFSRRAHSRNIIDQLSGLDYHPTTSMLIEGSIYFAKDDQFLVEE